MLYRNRLSMGWSIRGIVERLVNEYLVGEYLTILYAMFGSGIHVYVN